MPSFVEIQNEIQRESIPTTPCDLVRRRYLAELSENWQNTVLYYSGWLQKPARSIIPLMSISDHDKNGFMSAIHKLDTSKGLDIILHTPGGDLAATESLIDYLNQKFDGDMRAIIPQIALSGGTLIAFACKEIWMGKQSSLGPIDPQINGLPASGIISEFYKANEEIRKDANKVNIWGPVLSRYHPSLIENCKKAMTWSKELASMYLLGSMFRQESAYDPKNLPEKIDKILQVFTEQGITKSHARHIPKSVCHGVGLNIKDIENDQELQDIILSIHHASVLTIMNTHAIKIIENQNAQAHITKYSKQ